MNMAPLLKLLVLAGILAWTTTSTPAAARPSESSVVKTYIYSANGRLVGHIERGGPGWNVSEWCNSVIEIVSDSRYVITEGFHSFGFVRRQSVRRWDIYRDGHAGPEFEGSVRRVNRARWNIYRRGRRVGHTRGSDGVAAGFAYIFWFGQGCFDL